VTTIGLADTNTNPESITYHIPANDDGIKSIDFITKLMVEAIKNGRAIRLAHRATAEGQAQDSAPRQGSGQAPRQGSGQEKKDETKTESTK
jgi:small subunit ribosomal protein S2